MRRAVALVAGVVASLLLAGCTPIVTLAPAPEATSVACAGVIVRLPDRILSAEKRETDAQGTAAWGQPVTVLLRCGVTQTPPSSQCVTFQKVDWKVQALPDEQQYVLTTYGRTPAVQVVFDSGLPSAQVMPPISDAVAAAIPRASAACTVAGDPGATSSPRP